MPNCEAATRAGAHEDDPVTATVCRDRLEVQAARADRRVLDVQRGARRRVDRVGRAGHADRAAAGCDERVACAGRRGDASGEVDRPPGVRAQADSSAALVDRAAEGDSAAGATGDGYGVAGAPADGRREADIAGRRTGEVNSVAAGTRDVHSGRRADGRTRDRRAVDPVTARAADVQALDVDAARESNARAGGVRDRRRVRAGCD